MPVQIGQKSYLTVAERIASMRTNEEKYYLTTEILSVEDNKVLVRAELKDSDGNIVSTGHAEEERGSGNQFTDGSEVEVCETSAIGRCLANAYWAGDENQMDPQIASADEVGNAIRQQANKAYGKYMALVHEHWDSIVGIKEFLAGGNRPAALEAWRELGKDAMTELWKAPTKGGIFTTEERNRLREQSA